MRLDYITTVSLTIILSPTMPIITRVLKDLTELVAGKRGRVEALGSSTMAPDALKEAVKAHNYFRDKWR